MLTKDFRDIIESEIEELIIKHNEDDGIKKHKEENQKKSYAFLLWFLNKYRREIDPEIKKSITEGSGDASCDIIFSNEDRLGNTVYYVVQAKWFSKNKVFSSNKTTELIRASITDFKLILDGSKSKSKTNVNFNKKYDELRGHVRKNGRVKFIFLALCEISNENKEDYTDNFDESEYINLELFDINKLKFDYIELNYKGARTHNPLETPYRPIHDIKLELDVKNSIKIESPSKSFIFLVKPRLLYNLFKKYRFALFYRNIRNPLPNSNFNENIFNTLKSNPTKFWYYNNGITAITEKIEEFTQYSSEITVKGIQIINGAQTVYSIFKAFDQLSEVQKNYVNDRVLLTLRLITSISQEEDLEITRFTNSQNPVTERDFRSNDLVQKRIQRDFFQNTNIWYEIRRGEFRIRVPKNIEKVSNEMLGQTYLSFILKEPIKAKKSKKNLFLKSDEQKGGLYEIIYNDKTSYQDMQLSLNLYRFIENERKYYRKTIKKIENDKPNENYTEDEKNILSNRFLQYTTFNFLAAFQFLIENFPDLEVDIVKNKILSSFKNQRLDPIKNMYNFIRLTTQDLVIEKEKAGLFSAYQYFKSDEKSKVEIEVLSEINNACFSEISDVWFSENRNVGISENKNACF